MKTKPGKQGHRQGGYGIEVKTYYGGLITRSGNMKRRSVLLELKLQITNHKLQTNHNPKITNYKKRGVLRTNLDAFGETHLGAIFMPYRTVCNFGHCNLMSRKFYKLLIIENLQPTILHIPNSGNGIMECWNKEKKRWCKINNCSPQLPSFITSQLPSFRRRRLSARRAPTHHSIIPIFHHSSQL